jgi:hypothetical protein
MFCEFADEQNREAVARQNFRKKILVEAESLSLRRAVNGTNMRFFCSTLAKICDATAVDNYLRQHVSLKRHECYNILIIY